MGGRDDNDSVARVYLGKTGGGYQLSAAYDAYDKYIFIKLEVLERNAEKRRVIAHVELQRLRLIVHELIERFNVASV